MNIACYIIEIFYNIINVFTVTFDQFNASFLAKSISFIQKRNVIEVWIC